MTRLLHWVFLWLFLAGCLATQAPSREPPAPRIEPSPGSNDKVAPLGEGDARAAACFDKVSAETGDVCKAWL